MEVNWGPTGREVYERTYSRIKEDGSNETWADTVNRVIDGNLALVDSKYHLKGEREELFDHIFNFKIIPAGRHLWMSGIPGRSFLFNCHRAGWNEELSDHFCFTFDQLMQGGGVGANFSNRYIERYSAPTHNYRLTLQLNENHNDYDYIRDNLIDKFVHEFEFDGGEVEVMVVDDSREGWTHALREVINNFYTEEFEHIVLDFSKVRGKGEIIRTFGGTAAGPLPLMNALHSIHSLLSSRVGEVEPLDSIDMMTIDHTLSECVVAGNVRRSARMSIKSWKDDDIFEFINCKSSFESHWSTNISVEIDNDFFDAYEADDSHAVKVYDAVVDGMLTNGEPGFYNVSKASEGELGDVGATNPCGEIALEEWENCNLGHVNLAAFDSLWDHEVSRAHVLMTRFLIRATFADVPNKLQREVLNRNRRIGVGHMGLQNFINKNTATSYSEISRENDFEQSLYRLQAIVGEEAKNYAFELRIPTPIKTTTVAPTGSVAKLPGVSEGIHPIYGKYFIRRVRFSTIDPAQIQKIQEFENMGYNVEDCIYNTNTKVVEFITKDPLIEEALNPDLVESVDEIDLDSMLSMQETYQGAYANNAVSFTINIPKDILTEEYIIYFKAKLLSFLPQLKGTTVMVDESRPQAPYQRLTKEEYEALVVDRNLISDSIDLDCATGACPIK